MQNQIEHTQDKAHPTHRAEQAQCTVALPYVDPLTIGLVGQTVCYKGKAKRLLATALPSIDAINYAYKAVSDTLVAAIEAGAIDSQETRTIINGFGSHTDPRSVVHYLECKISNMAIDRELKAITANAIDIVEVLQVLGYTTEELDVGDLAVEDGVLNFSFSEALRFTVIDDRNLPHPIQLGIFAIAQYFGGLCSTATEESFIHYSEEYETLASLEDGAKRKLIALDQTMDPSAYLCAFKSLATETLWSDFISVMQEYYGYAYDEKEHHADIVRIIQGHIDRLAFCRSEQFKSAQHYRRNQSRKLLRRTQRLAQHYAKHPAADLLSKLAKLVEIAHQKRTNGRYEFEFLSDIYALDFQQAVCLKSMECEIINADFSESENYIMETGDYAKIAVCVDDADFMQVWRNHQLGWLLIHCLEQTMTEYQRHV